jgi:TPR repeat protein
VSVGEGLAGGIGPRAAERWCRAADTGNADAMADLGRLKTEAGEVRDAEAWLIAAAGKGHRGAMERPAALMAEAARTWRARAAGEH